MVLNDLILIRSGTFHIRKKEAGWERRKAVLTEMFSFSMFDLVDLKVRDDS